MALAEDLRQYISQHGRAETPAVAESRVVIVGEYHGTREVVKFLQKLLRDRRYKFFGNESFLNAGVAQQGVRDYWRQSKLPPPFNPNDVNVAREETAKRIFIRQFQDVLDDLKLHPRYILSIGSRTKGGIRDWRLAQHFFDEALDRGIGPQTPGVLLLGAAHAAAVPFHNGWTTTRMYLEQKGYDCVSILHLTNFRRNATHKDDTVFSATDPLGVRLTRLMRGRHVSISTRRQSGNGQRSPFYDVRLKDCNTGKSLAEQFEYLVLART